MDWRYCFCVQGACDQPTFFTSATPRANQDKFTEGPPRVRVSAVSFLVQRRGGSEGLVRRVRAFASLLKLPQAETTNAGKYSWSVPTQQETTTACQFQTQLGV